MEQNYILNRLFMPSCLSLENINTYGPLTSPVELNSIS